jgi:hypothetical protein
MFIKVPTEKQVCDLADRVADLRRRTSYRNTPVTILIAKVVQHVPQAQPLVAAELGKRGAQRRAQKARERRARAKLHAQEWAEYLEERFVLGPYHAIHQRRDHLLPDP